MSKRPLTPDEIQTLQARGCTAESWDSIEVHTEFSPAWCTGVSFSGKVSIGKLGQTLTGRVVPKMAGISSAHLHNVTIEDGVYICGVKNHIANYTIEKDVFIENVNTIEVTGKTSFGNGVMVNVLNEQGGRAIPITTQLSAQIAYMLVFYRHKPKLIEALLAIINKEVEEHSFDRGTIGAGTSITNTGIISNVQISPSTDIHNAQRLRNGTVFGTKESPVIIGTGVMADEFLIGPNSQLHDQTIISHCFIGSGCYLSRGLSAEHSLFFANFIGSHGEVYSTFAGPHTVTHHKSTLLIGAYMSFLNAGSGSNQSNNLYKLGPLHQGVIERGSKTASDSYILWPARVGAFTLITGRHTNHSDTSKLPYSYLVEQDNETYCIPGVNFKSVGTIRDADKWPQRDKRAHSCPDIINYDLLSPFTVGKMEEGVAILNDLLENQVHNTRELHYNGVKIPLVVAEKGVKYYQLGVFKYVGNTLVDRILTNSISSKKDLFKTFQPTSKVGNEQWVDMAGCIAPKSQVNELISAIESGEIATTPLLQKRILNLHENYSEWAWNWCAARITAALPQSVEEVSRKTLISLLDKWLGATKKLDDFFLADAKKEFSPRSQIGFGIDGDAEEQHSDFSAVRGDYEENDFLQRVMKHVSQKQELYDTVASLINTHCE